MLLMSFSSARSTTVRLSPGLRSRWHLRVWGSHRSRHVTTLGSKDCRVSKSRLYTALLRSCAERRRVSRP